MNEEDYDLLDIHDRIQKYLTKLQDDKQSTIQTIISILFTLNNKTLPYGSDKLIIEEYNQKYDNYLTSSIQSDNTNCKKKKQKKVEPKSKVKTKLKDETNYITYKEWKDMCSTIKDNEFKLEQLEITLPFLLATVEPIVNNYLTELKIPIISTFIGTKVNTSSEKCITIYNEYIEKCKDIIGEEQLYLIIKKQPKLNIASLQSLCNTKNINNTTIDVENDDTKDYSKDENKVQYDDIGRVNLNQKYKYERKCHFRDTLQQFQGIQNKQINEKVYKDLEEMIQRHSLLDTNYTDQRKFNRVTLQHIRIFLNECGYYQHYEDRQLIFTKLTGKPSPNISKYEKELYQDFDQLVQAFMQLPEDIKKNRKNFLNNQYVLTQLLKRRNIKVPEIELDYLKTPSRLREHDEIYGLCCEILKWNFTPLS